MTAKTLARCAVYKSKVKLLFFFVLLLRFILIIYHLKHLFWCEIYLINLPT